MTGMHEKAPKYQLDPWKRLAIAGTAASTAIFGISCATSETAEPVAVAQSISPTEPTPTPTATTREPIATKTPTQETADPTPTETTQTAEINNEPWYNPHNSSIGTKFIIDDITISGKVHLLEADDKLGYVQMLFWLYDTKIPDTDKDPRYLETIKPIVYGPDTVPWLLTNKGRRPDAEAATQTFTTYMQMADVLAKSPYLIDSQDHKITNPEVIKEIASSLFVALAPSTENLRLSFLKESDRSDGIIDTDLLIKRVRNGDSVWYTYSVDKPGRTKTYCGRPREPYASPFDRMYTLIDGTLTDESGHGTKQAILISNIINKEYWAPSFVPLGKDYMYDDFNAGGNIVELPYIAGDYFDILDDINDPRVHGLYPTPIITSTAQAGDPMVCR